LPFLVLFSAKEKRTGRLVISHWLLVISKEAEKGRKGDRRQSRRLKLFVPIYRCGIKNIALDFGFVIWNLGFGIFLIWQFLANLAVCSFKKNKAENGHW
jgi:hypothetical protein